MSKSWARHSGSKMESQSAGHDFPPLSMEFSVDLNTPSLSLDHASNQKYSHSPRNCRLAWLPFIHQRAVPRFSKWYPGPDYLKTGTNWCTLRNYFLIWTFTLKIDVMVFQSDSSYHLHSEQTAFNRQTGKHSLNSACICHSQILNYEVISVWKGDIEKNLSMEYGFPSGTRLMVILRIHLKIYLSECRFHQRIYNNSAFYIKR